MIVPPIVMPLSGQVHWTLRTCKRCGRKPMVQSKPVDQWAGLCSLCRDFDSYVEDLEAFEDYKDSL